MSTDFGTDSSSHFPFRAQTNTDASERSTPCGYTAGMGNDLSHLENA